MALPGSLSALVPHAAGGPCARLLSNGTLTSLVSAEGTGFTQLDWRRITSWTPDPVEDHEGLFLYLRDEEDGALWSLGHEPVTGAPDRYHVRSEPGLLRIERSERGIEAVCEIAVGADRHAELRRIRLRNAGARPRRLSLTSYVGVVLHHPGGHAGHPGFSKLFVQTSVDAAAGVLFARRRPRGSTPEPLHFAHAVFGPGAASFETDRARFVGRGRPASDVDAAHAGVATHGAMVITILHGGAKFVVSIVAFVAVHSPCAVKDPVSLGRFRRLLSQDSGRGKDESREGSLCEHRGTPD